MWCGYVMALQFHNSDSWMLTVSTSEQGVVGFMRDSCALQRFNILPAQRVVPNFDGVVITSRHKHGLLSMEVDPTNRPVVFVKLVTNRHASM